MSVSQSVIDRSSFAYVPGLYSSGKIHLVKPRPDQGGEMAYSGGGYHVRGANGQFVQLQTSPAIQKTHFDENNLPDGSPFHGVITNSFRGSSPLAVEGGVGVRATFGASTFPSKYSFNGMVTLNNTTGAGYYQNTPLLTGTYTLFYLAKRSDGGVILGDGSDVRFFKEGAGLVAGNVYNLGDGVYLLVSNPTTFNGGSSVTGVLMDGTAKAYTVDCTAISVVSGSPTINDYNWMHYYVDTTGGAASSVSQLTTFTAPADLQSASKFAILSDVFVPGATGIASAIQAIMAINDGTSSNRVVLRFSDQGRLTIVIVNGGVQQTAITTANGYFNQRTRSVLFVEENNVRLIVNGQEVLSDTTVTLPTRNTIYLANDITGSGGNSYLSGIMKSALVQTGNNIFTQQEAIDWTTI